MRHEQRTCSFDFNSGQLSRNHAEVGGMMRLIESDIFTNAYGVISYDTRYQIRVGINACSLRYHIRSRGKRGKCLKPVRSRHNCQLSNRVVDLARFFKHEADVPVQVLVGGASPTIITFRTIFCAIELRNLTSIIKCRPKALWYEVALQCFYVLHQQHWQSKTCGISTMDTCG